ncbi:MAG TPA: TIGR03936 family radical SAM-associated protein [Candidatus Bathyarchaeia archaeon]|nr:TIGR03936 family radical SAM-associated protein [Candidatus Bathyarchaeia archaeon]
MSFSPEREGAPERFDSFAAAALFPLVERPSRYADGEMNLASDGFREGRLNVLLVFPDAYEIGMSHLGIRFLYHRLAAMEGVGVELAFAPWPDAAHLFRACGEPLRSLQTGTPAGRFDLIGLSVTYELHYTNLLLVLDLAGVPLEVGARREGDPIVVAGGPACTNPLPFIEAVDAVFLGDGEDSLAEAAVALARLKGEGASRAARREALAGIEGVYVDGISTSVSARTHRFAPGDLPRRPIVPSSEVVHQRLAIEIMRGCSRGCRFCHAGVFYRPCRERSVDEIVDAALEGLDATGWDEVSLLSLSTSDYSRLDELLSRLVPELERRKVSLALPSLRPETITSEIVSASSTVTKSGFTLAPEAGTERLRRVIRKDFTNEEILDGVARILAGGWQTLKLYFMIGLPTETEADLDGVAWLIARILTLPRRQGRFSLGVSISPFVPKPHTPFQWERQCSIEELRAKEEYLSRRIRSAHVNLSLRHPETSALEGILARGDRRLWPVIRRAYELGCVFDGWNDRLRFDLWERSLKESGLETPGLVDERPLDEPLPWEAFELHATKSLLRAERDRAYDTAVPTPGPASGQAKGPSLGTAASTVAPTSTVPEAVPSAAPVPAAGPAEGTAMAEAAPGRQTGTSAPLPVFRYRFVFAKTGRERFLSHIETMNVIQRALRRAKMPLSFTEGFHPHPRISAGPSLAVGMEGLGEFFDVELVKEEAPFPELLNRFLPGGIRIRRCVGPFTRNEGRLPHDARYTYLLRFDTLRGLMKSSGRTSEVLSDSERMWYLLAQELGIDGGLGFSDCGSPVDPAQWFEAEWRRMFERGASLKSEKGKERSCAGCAVRRIDDPAVGALELVLPGAVGAPRPQDLLQVFIPKNIASLVRIQRLEITYRCEEDFKDPVAVIEAKRQKT